MDKPYQARDKRRCLRYNIKHVFLVFRIENEFKANEYHGSLSYKDEKNFFFPIKFYSLSFAVLLRFPGSDKKSSCEMDISLKQEGTKIVGTAKTSSRASVLLLNCLDDWCLEHLEHFVDFFAFGAHGLSGV